MISRFFIDRPIFAAVLSILLTFAGAVSVVNLPIEQYPNIVPPTVQVSATYAGASAQVVADTIAAPIEQQVSGVDKMLYMSSTSTNNGGYTLTVTFDVGTDPNTDQVLTQNRVANAMANLPQTVQATGVTTNKQSPNVMLVVNLFSPDGRYDQLYLSNYATIQIKDELLRLPGVGNINFFGEQDYSIRFWLDPDKLAARNLTASDVLNVVQSQNVQVASGYIGQEPVPPGQPFQLVLNTLGMLTDPDQFADIIVKTGTQGQIVRMRDVVRDKVTLPNGSVVEGVELGAKNQDVSCTVDGRPSVGLAIFQLPGANALDTAKLIKAKMEELKLKFPTGLDYAIYYDTTPFIQESIVEVFKTLRDAIILVAIVVLVFLQNWRSALIPLIAVPVAVVGTFAVLLMLGFSLNNLSLFGLVLAIGIVVDDAIVVVENVERWLEQGLSPKEAARKAMDEVTSPVIAVALVLCSVFLPCAFISGITGEFFRQFAVTIAVSTVISAFNSLTLSPALAALLLRPREHKPDLPQRLIQFLFGWFFRLFNWSFDVSTNVYTRIVGASLRFCLIVLAIYGGLLYLTFVGFTRTPTGFIPAQDQGYLIVNVQLPDSASLYRTQKALAKIEEIALKTPGVAHTVSIGGESVVMSNAYSSNWGSMYLILDDFDKRRDPELSGPAIQRKLQREFYVAIEDAQVVVFGPPAVMGLGNAGGFKLMVEDRGSLGLVELQSQADALAAAADKDPRLFAVFSQFRASTPQLYIDIDRTKCERMKVSMQDVFSTLQAYIGTTYVNNFVEFGRTWQVNLQADAKYRVNTDAISQLKVRNVAGQMIPLGTVAEVKEVTGPVMVMRYNMFPAAAITGNLAPGTSTGESIAIMENLASTTLLRQMGYEWTEITYMQILAGNTAMYVFAAAVFLVFLVLSAQYESWALPLSVILVVPMCLLCSVIGVNIARMDIDIFTQIGFVVLVGLASKNAILIVEFAKARRESGQPLFESAVEACRLRLRPILMTSFAFILGVVPLVISKGAGAELRRALGTAVFSGMLGVTFFGIFLTPVFFYAIGWFRRSKDSTTTPRESDLPASEVSLD